MLMIWTDLYEWEIGHMDQMVLLPKISDDNFAVCILRIAETTRRSKKAVIREHEILVSASQIPVFCNIDIQAVLLFGNPFFSRLTRHSSEWMKEEKH